MIYIKRPTEFLKTMVAKVTSHRLPIAILGRFDGKLSAMHTNYHSLIVTFGPSYVIMVTIMQCFDVANLLRASAAANT